MKSKVTLLVSIFLSAAILTVIGGIVTLTGNEKSALSSTATQTSAMQATQVAGYQNLLAQANQTINQANAEITSLQAQNQQQSSSPTATPYPILPDQAAAIASKATGGVSQTTPRLVNYNGQVAYEVAFPSGNVYVDAITGSILYNGANQVKTIDAQQAAQIAIAYSGNNNVLNVATGLYNGAPAFQVTFQNGEVVYVDNLGNVIAVQLPSNVQSKSNSEQDD